MSLRKPSPLSPNDLARIVSDSEAAGKVEAAKPTWKEVAEAFPDCPVMDQPNGKRTVRISHARYEVARRRLQVVNEMFSTSNRLDCDLGRERHGRITEVSLRDRDGRVRQVPEPQADRLAHQAGLLPIVRFGGLKVREDTDGYLWREDGRGGWEPLKRKCLGTPWPWQANGTHDG